jgi:hypothetical protein
MTAALQFFFAFIQVIGMACLLCGGFTALCGSKEGAAGALIGIVLILMSAGGLGLVTL